MRTAAFRRSESEKVLLQGRPIPYAYLPECPSTVGAGDSRNAKR